VGAGWKRGRGACSCCRRGQQSSADAEAGGLLARPAKECEPKRGLGVFRSLESVLTEQQLQETLAPPAKQEQWQFWVLLPFINSRRLFGKTGGH